MGVASSYSLRKRQPRAPQIDFSKAVCRELAFVFVPPMRSNLLSPDVMLSNIDAQDGIIFDGHVVSDFISAEYQDGFIQRLKKKIPSDVSIAVVGVNYSANTCTFAAVGSDRYVNGDNGIEVGIRNTGELETWTSSTDGNWYNQYKTNIHGSLDSKLISAVFTRQYDGGVTFADEIDRQGSANAQTGNIDFEYVSVGGYINGSGNYVSDAYGVVIALIAIWGRKLSNYEVTSIQRNPWQIFKGQRKLIQLSSITLQYLRPASDSTIGSWVASTGATLFGCIDEAVLDAGDHIDTLNPSTSRVKLSSGNVPDVENNHTLSYTIDGIGGLIVRLQQNTTTIASWTHDPVPTSVTTFDQALTAPQMAAITDASNLYLELEAF